MGKGLDRKVRYPITWFVVTLHIKASVIAVEVVAYVKFRATSISRVRKIRGLYSVAQEEGMPSLLNP